MTNTLQITFSNENNETLNICYNLLNNTVVDKFILLLNDIQLQPFVETRFNNFCINVGNMHDITVDKYTDLTNNIALFENENNNGYIFENKFTFNDINQHNLNKLHTEFETYLVIFTSGTVLTNEKNYKKKYEKNVLKNNFEYKNIKKYLNNINCLIHNLEAVIQNNNNTTYSSGYFSTYLYSKPYVNPIMLEHDELKLFTVDIKWGELLLGYGTTGKSLYHVFKDRDLALLENGFNLSPQEYVTPNIMGMFLETDEYHYNEFYQWFVDNNIQEKYNIDFNDKKNANGYIKLGDLICDNRQDFLLNLSKYPNIINYTISKNNNLIN